MVHITPIPQFPISTLEIEYNLLNIPHVQVVLEDHGDEVEIVFLGAESPGKGQGTLAMTALTRLADALSTNLILFVAGTPNSCVHTQLVTFYKRFGFYETEEEQVMKRPFQVALC